MAKRLFKKKDNKLPGGAARLTWSIFVFVAGTLFGLYVVQWFVAYLPGPKVQALVAGLRGTTPTTSGCVYYMVMLHSDEPLEYVYFKAQFSERITAHHIGFPQESINPNARHGFQSFVGSKTAEGECTVRAGVNNTADVQSAATGNLVAFHASKLPKKANIMGLVATAEVPTTPRVPRQPTYTEGEYEYSRLGQTVRKSLVVLDKGVVDAK